MIQCSFVHFDIAGVCFLDAMAWKIVDLPSLRLMLPAPDDLFSDLLQFTRPSHAIYRRITRRPQVYESSRYTRAGLRDGGRVGLIGAPVNAQVRRPPCLGAATWLEGRALVVLGLMVSWVTCSLLEGTV